MHLERKAAQTAAWLRGKGVPDQSRALLVGTRRGGFSNELGRVVVLPLRRVPGCRVPLVPGWESVIISGELAGAPAIVQEGRIHFFEGFLPGEVGFTVRVLAALGVRSLVLVAEGRPLPGVPGTEVTLAADRIDLTGVPLLRGALAGPQGPVFEPAPPSPGMCGAIRAAAAAHGVRLAEGVVSLIHGPAWPTGAEARMMRTLGADVVTMALAPELATASRLGIDCAAILFDPAVGWERRHVDFCRDTLASI